MQLLAGAEPIFYRGSEIGCLCLHGFMAAPTQMRWMGQHLAAQGYTVYCPRLAGHGIDPRLISHLRWEDYYASVLDGYHLLRQQCEHIFVFGLSMGGTLALLLASQTNVTGIGVMASPVQFDSRLMPHANWVRYFKPYNFYPTPPELNEKIKAEQAQRGEPITGQVRYELWSVAAINQLYKLVQTTYAKLPAVNVPLLLIYSEKDDVVSHDNCELIANRVGSQHIEKHYLKKSGHILTQDDERQTVLQLAAEFVQSVCANR